MYEYVKSATIIAALVIIDQISKYIIRVTGGFYICNTGIAFGIKLPFFLILLILMILIFYLVAGNYKSKITNIKQITNSKNQNPKPFWIFDFENWNLFVIWNFKFEIFLIISGGLSNLIDRIHYGCVIDFIDLKIWPVFNIADIYITIGGIMLIYLYVFKSSFGSDNRSGQ